GRPRPRRPARGPDDSPDRAAHRRASVPRLGARATALARRALRAARLRPHGRRGRADRPAPDRKFPGRAPQPALRTTVMDTSVSAPGSNTLKIETVDYVPGCPASVQVLTIIP